MKPHPSPRCVSSLSQQTSRAPNVTANDNGARAFSSETPKPLGALASSRGVAQIGDLQAGCAAPVVESPRTNPGLKPVGASFAAVIGKLVVE